MNLSTEYRAAIASGAWQPLRGSAPGPACPECHSLETRLLPGTLAQLGCGACGHTWHPSTRGGISTEVIDALGAEAADRRRGLV